MIGRSHDKTLIHIDCDFSKWFHAVNFTKDSAETHVLPPLGASAVEWQRVTSCNCGKSFCHATTRCDGLAVKHLVTGVWRILMLGEQPTAACMSRRQ